MVVCLILISVILLQAGKGGGLTETFGGGEATQSILGTQAPVILKKATTVAAVAFLVTSLVLGMVTSRRGRSLLSGMRMPTVSETAKKENADSAKAGKGIASETGVKVTPKNESDSSTPTRL